LANVALFASSDPNSSHQSYALVSLTLPIVDNLNSTFVLGYMTVVASASSLIQVTQSREGLGNTGMVLLVGPNRRENIFKYVNRPATGTYLPAPGGLENATVKVRLPYFPSRFSSVGNEEEDAPPSSLLLRQTRLRHSSLG
jgi:osomolarity two-component system sensor histidine kinase SLN1